MIRITEQYMWQVIFSIFFLLLVIMGMIILATESRLALADYTLVDYVLVTLATWRLIRLFIYDAITKFFREQFADVVKVQGGYVFEKPTHGPRRAIYELLHCPWCLGVWMAATVVFFYSLTALAVYPVMFLAISAVASFLQILTNFLGWQAERAKSEVEGR